MDEDLNIFFEETKVMAERNGITYRPKEYFKRLIDNYDAEGRLTLADAIYYASDVLKADRIVDLATLTGACVVALGSYRTGVVTNNDEFMNEMNEASVRADEKYGLKYPKSEYINKDNYKSYKTSSLSKMTR